MSEYLVKSKSLTSIADEIRTLSGTTTSMGLDSMKTKLADANSEVEDQSALVTQIISALYGKTAEGNITIVFNNATVIDDGNGNITIN